jgi:hypothetical protein
MTSSRRDSDANDPIRSAAPLKTTEDQAAAGKSIRSRVSRQSHAHWHPSKGRPDPVEMLVESSKGRIPHLIPIRYGRMLQSPFAFFRGAASIMAEDLSHAPTTGLRVQSCGDCHLVNFGGYATPERRMVFDINDFDETLPAPWEWDVKRLAASFFIAGRNNRLSLRDTRRSTLACIESYRTWMSKLAGMRVLDAWYMSIDEAAVLREISDQMAGRRVRRRFAKAKGQSAAESLFPRLTHVQGGRISIKDQQPLIFHPEGAARKNWLAIVDRGLKSYRETLQEDRRVLFDQYRLVDMSMKVVGVGSVGTRCGILLMLASENDPLFLQIKEARTSVLEPYAGKSLHKSRGQRVVTGQRIMQSASDLFLGWTRSDKGHDFYLRQLRDAKIKPLVEIFGANEMMEYGRLCGWALARAHARSPGTAAISGYLGKSDAFDRAIADFAAAYAEQNDRDYAALVKAVRSGDIEAKTEG